MDDQNISVVVMSRLSGQAAGHLVITTRPSATVDSVISAFCVDRGIKRKTLYVLRTNNNEYELDATKTLLASEITDGDVLFLTTTVGEMTFGFSNWWCLAAIAVTIGTVGIVAVSMIFSKNGEVPTNYGMVFDAGSTHTSMMLFAWNGAKVNGSGAPWQITSCLVTGHGLTSFVGREDQLGPALDVCLKQGKENIPGGLVFTTPVYLGATAGMRLLNIQDPAETQTLMAVVSSTLSKCGLSYAPGMSRIVSGDEEGVDGWIQTNYLANNFINGNGTMGTLDLGGASTQFAAHLTDGATVDTMDVMLYGRIHNVSVYSYLCFGRRQARFRHQALLTIGMNSSLLTVVDPCLPEGYKVTVAIRDIFSSPCTWMNPELRPKLSPETNVTFVGSSTSTTCAENLQNQLDMTVCQDAHNFTFCFNKQNLSSHRMPFMAFSGFYASQVLLNLTDTSSTFDQMNVSTGKLCSMNWNQTTEYAKEIGSPANVFPQHYCFDSMYAFQLLTEGYSFDKSSWNLLTFTDTIKGEDLGWAMGYMINATNSFLPADPVEYLDEVVFVSLVVLLVVFILLGMAFGIHAWKQKREAPRYQRLSQYGAI